MVKKMDEEETEQFFLSIVEYDKSEESKYKVTMENLQFFVDEDEDLHISCEIRRRYRKEYSVNLLYALYDLKGRLRYAPTDVCVGFTSPSDSSLKPISVYFSEMKAGEIGKIRLYWQSPDFQYY